MDPIEQTVRRVVEQVVKELSLQSSADAGKAPGESGSGYAGPGIFRDVDGAVRAASAAQKELLNLTLETRKAVIREIRETALANLEVISRKAQDETGMGCWRNKVAKNELAARKTPGVEDLESQSWTDDHGLTLVERAPYGVIASIIPSTNPTATVINNAISMISGGNSVVFNPHPGARGVSCFAVSLLHDAVVKAGGPANLVTAIAEPTIASAEELMKHPGVALLVVTGGPAVVKVAMNSGKKVIAAGPGNPPCVVDETADLTKAGKDIVDGAGFDNNIVCICEKEILAVASIADRLKEELKKNGAFELTGDQTDRVTRLVIAEPGGPGKEGSPVKKWVGKRAHLIAAAAGVTVPETTKILIAEVGREHPLVWTEQLMPVLPLVRMKDVDEAIDLAVACEHEFRHTAVMHSKNIEKLSKMAKLMNCSLFVKNGPCYSGLGSGGAGFTSFTIASPTGEGLTRARTFTRERRCTLVDYFRIV